MSHRSLVSFVDHDLSRLGKCLAKALRPFYCVSFVFFRSFLSEYINLNFNIEKRCNNI